MLKDLISNVALIVSFILLGGEVFKNNRLKLDAPLKTRVIAGVTAGILGCLLMIYGVRVAPETILDLRQFAIIVVAIHGGIVSSVITGIIMAIFRITYFGINPSSIIALFLIIAISLSCGLISQLKVGNKKKWIYMNIVSTICVIIAISIVLEDKIILIKSITYLVIMSFSTAVLTYYLSKHVVLSNTLLQKYKSESSKDFLTGLNNVRSFDIMLNRMLENTMAKDEDLSILMIDIDHFKKVNDTYGHSEGDAVLEKLGSILSNMCRSFDVVSRIGGEEFCILLPRCSSAKAIEVGERIRREVEKRSFKLTTGLEINITVSIGVVSYPETTRDVDILLEQADKALYASKRNGRNQVSLLQCKTG